MLVWEPRTGGSRAEAGAGDVLEGSGGGADGGCFGSLPLTPGHGGDDLAEGAAAQLVLRQDAELVARVRLQILHQEVLSPHRHRE